MKIIFNDATEISVQQVEYHGDYLRVLTVGNTPEQLKALFTDSTRTSRMIVQERGQTIAKYEGYTVFHHTETYTGKIYGVAMCKRGGVDNPEGMYGQKEKLFFPPSAMVGQYFEVATE